MKINVAVTRGKSQQQAKALSKKERLVKEKGW